MNPDAVTLVVGSSGFLGRVLVDVLRPSNRVVPTHHSTKVFSDSLPFDLFSGDLEPVFSRQHIDTVIFSAAVETEPTEQVTRAVRRLLGFCEAKRFVYLSSDGIFGGESGRYREDAEVAPRTLYGRNLHFCEALVRHTCQDHCIVRPSYLYGFSHGQLDPRLARTRAALAAGETVTLYSDMYKSPLGVQQVAEAVAWLSRSDFVGTVHVAGPRLSVYDFHTEAMRALGVDTVKLAATPMPVATSGTGLPRDTSLDTSWWQELTGTTPLSVTETLLGSRL